MGAERLERQRYLRPPRCGSYVSTPLDPDLDDVARRKVGAEPRRRAGEDHVAGFERHETGQIRERGGAKEKMRLARVPRAVLSPLFTSVRSVRSSSASSTAWGTGRGGPIGVKPSWPFASTFEPRSARAKVVYTDVVRGSDPADALAPSHRRSRRRSRRAADHDRDLTLVAEELATPAGARSASPSTASEGRRLEEVGRRRRHPVASSLPRAACVVQVDRDDLGGSWRQHHRLFARGAQ